mmetsp:Transcript_30374/g.77496  ORF Transcript_30374/g.77496 Transcript_30374/m.77496 type:complete len:214 (-) Transcript_30374:1939-2580(-)
MGSRPAQSDARRLSASDTRMPSWSVEKRHARGGGSDRACSSSSRLGALLERATRRHVHPRNDGLDVGSAAAAAVRGWRHGSSGSRGRRRRCRCRCGRGRRWRRLLLVLVHTLRVRHLLLHAAAVRARVRAPALLKLEARGRRHARRGQGARVASGPQVEDGRGVGGHAATRSQRAALRGGGRAAVGVWLLRGRLEGAGRAKGEATSTGRYASC